MPKVKLVPTNVSLPAILEVPAEPNNVPDTSEPVVSDQMVQNAIN
jgi:hypothetical protein